MKNFFQNTIIQIIGGLIILGLIIWGSIAMLGNHGQNLNTIPVSLKNLNETVTATGAVAPDTYVTLSFDMQGKIAATYVDVGSIVHKGDVLAALSSGTLLAQLDGAKADLAAAEAKLADMVAGARPEELALYQQKYDAASTALIAAMKSAYVQTQDALIGKSDSLFTNGDTINPVLIVRTDSQSQQISIQNQRVSLRDAMSSWKASLDNLNQSSGAAISADLLQSGRNSTTNTLALAKNFLDNLAIIANNINTSNSGQSQSVINAEQSAVSVANQELSGAITAEQASDAAWGAARDALALEQSGSTANSITAQRAVVAKAQSAVEAIQTQLGHSLITAPFEGTVTSVGMKVGEVYVPGISAGESIGLMSNGLYKVEVYVPEIDIAKIAVGNPVDITLDAYGSDIVFPASVSLVDPAQTVQKGMSAYKVTVRFDDLDSRVKSGMTANVSIKTKSVSNTLAVPSSAIITRGTDKFVLEKGASGFTERRVDTGIASADGYTQIVSGLAEGDLIAVFGNNQ